MADIMIRADKVSSTIQRIREAQEAALAFRSELATVKRSLLSAEGDLCGVEGTLAALRAMADAQERRAEDLGAQADRIEAF
ncbi:MAG: hypothetical protein LBG81_03760, partial [Coriobacteriaceae bacterium]|nr:hypothetical protein [Coriobacteriaceae bacterium]